MPKLKNTTQSLVGTEKKIPLSVQERLDTLTALRQDLHSFPELRFEEFRTSDLLAERLLAAGLEVDRGLAGTGIVATLRGPDDSQAVMFRADMDALPITEVTDLAYASEKKGVMHACGHDGHMTMLIGAAEILAQEKSLTRTIHFVFQPGEEGGAGADRMIKEGLLERFPVAEAYAIHNWPDLPAGVFEVGTGPVMASGVRFTILIEGRGAHAAQPQHAIDPLIPASELVLALQSLVSRSCDPLDAAVISTCMIHGGTTDNVIADSVELRGTVRTLSNELMQKMQNSIRRVAEHVAFAHGATANTKFHQFYPATVNTKAESTRALDVAASNWGQDAIATEVPPSMASEDFGFILEKVPGAFIKLGTHNDLQAPLHNPHYDFNDDVLAVGVSFWVLLARSF